MKNAVELPDGLEGLITSPFQRDLRIETFGFTVAFKIGYSAEDKNLLLEVDGNAYDSLGQIERAERQRVLTYRLDIQNEF